MLNQTMLSYDDKSGVIVCFITVKLKGKDLYFGSFMMVNKTLSS